MLECRIWNYASLRFRFVFVFVIAIILVILDAMGFLSFFRFSFDNVLLSIIVGFEHCLLNYISVLQELRSNEKYS